MATRPIPEDQTPKLPLVVSPENRDQSTNKDAKMVNAYAEKSPSGELMVIKRPGYLTHTVVTGTGLGVTNWLGDVYAVFGNDLYKNGISVGSGISATGGIYIFSFTLGGTPTLFFHNTTNAYKYEGGGGLVAVTTNFPTLLVPGTVYLDGTTYVMTPAAEIRGSNINDVADGAWSSLNSIIAQIEPDGGVALFKQLVYCVAFKAWSTEIFYDAANAAGSPLGTVQGAKVNYGCRHAGTVADVEGTLVWVSTTRNGNIGVHAMEGLKAQPISTPPVEKLLQLADYTNVWAFGVKISGHRFYILTLKNSNLTLVYDLNTSLWSQWTDPNGNYFPFVSASFAVDKQIIMQHETNGRLYQLGANQLSDDGVLIPVDIVTPNYDGGVRVIKTLWKMDFVSDKTPGSTIQVRVSDDDYKTWSNFRTVDLNRARPYLTDCGSFFIRAHHIRHRANTPLRIMHINLTVDMGTL